MAKDIRQLAASPAPPAEERPGTISGTRRRITFSDLETRPFDRRELEQLGIETGRAPQPAPVPAPAPAPVPVPVLQPVASRPSDPFQPLPFEEMSRSVVGLAPAAAVAPLAPRFRWDKFVDALCATIAIGLCFVLVVAVAILLATAAIH